MLETMSVMLTQGLQYSSLPNDKSEACRDQTLQLKPEAKTDITSTELLGDSIQQELYFEFLDQNKDKCLGYLVGVTKDDLLQDSRKYGLIKESRLME